MWEDDWKRLSKRIDAWVESANIALTHMERAGALDERANEAIGREGGRILDSLFRLDLPDELRSEVTSVRNHLGAIVQVTQGRYLIANRLMALIALRAPIDAMTRDSEEPRRRLIERAFLHLNRTLVVDATARRAWSDAFAHETRCEQLGALHLLSHGVYAFKADAVSGRTDLILQEPLALTEDVKSAEAMVLTEWKLVRDEEPSARALEGKEQVTRYATVELGGFELRKHRYVVLVSWEPITVPPPESLATSTIHFVNVAIQRSRPSTESRRRVSQTGKKKPGV